MVLCRPLLVGGVPHCRHVVAFRVGNLRRVFFLPPFFDIPPFDVLLLHTICPFFAFLLSVAVRHVAVVRLRIGVRRWTESCFVDMQVCRWNMFAGMEGVLLMVFCLFVEC
jgi:hypothetical protein